MQLTYLVFLALCGAGVASAGPVLYAIGAVGNGHSNHLVQIDTNTQTVTTLTTIGDGSTSYRGLLQTGATTFSGYSMSGDFITVQASFTSAGVVTPGFAFGQFPVAGMATDGTLVWTGYNGVPVGSFSAIHQGNIGFYATSFLSGAMIGVAYNATDQYIYALYSASGFARIVPYSRTTNSWVPGADRAIASNRADGGFAWDPGTGHFFFIETPVGGQAALWEYDGVNSPTQVMSLGSLSYRFSSLTVGGAIGGGGETSGTPEPSSAFLVIAGLTLCWRKLTARGLR